MPDRDPAAEPENLSVHWYGQEMSENAKAGLRELSERFPNSAKELWVLPQQRPGATGQQEKDRLLAGYAEEAAKYGFEVKHVRDEVDTLAVGLEPKYTSQTLGDIFSAETSNSGHIASKDLAFYLVAGSKTSLNIDLSHHHMRASEWEAVQNDPSFSPEVVAPIDFSTAELKVVDLSHGEDANMRHVLNSGFHALTERHDDAGIEAQFTPHLDAFVLYAREGTKGQEVALAAAGQHIGYLAQIAQDEVRKGNVTFRPGDDRTRFRPETINLAVDNLLAAKYNPGDPRREDIIGRMNISALTDAIHLVYGTPVTPPGQGKDSMPMLQVDRDTWGEITAQAFQVGNVRVLPQFALGKDNQGSWRVHGDRDPGDLRSIPGEKVTLVQASNLGVSEAAGAGIDGLDKPSRIPYKVQLSSSAGNSPRRTPSPASSDESVGQITSQVAALTMPRTPSPEGPGLTDAAAAQPVARPAAKRAATGLTR